MKDILFPAFIGALGGGAVALAVWKLSAVAIDRQFASAGEEMLNSGEQQLRAEIRRSIDEQIPARVRSEMDAKFREVGITADTGRQLNAVLTLAESTGLIGLSGIRRGGVVTGARWR